MTRRASSVSAGQTDVDADVRRVTVISGAARGQGLSHAIGFAKAGHHVVLIDTVSQIDTVPYPTSTAEDLESARRMVDLHGSGYVRSYIADVRDSDALESAVDDVVKEFGRIDVVVANAGIFSFASNTWSISEEQWRTCVDVNLFGAWNLARSCIPHMLGRPGANLVFIGSVSAHKGIACTAHYVAAKHGLVGLMRTLAIELAPHGLRANMISPTATATVMATNPAMAECVRLQEAVGSSMANLLSVALLDPHDVTEAVLWLTSEAARHVTGICLPVDAGFSVR